MIRRSIAIGLALAVAGAVQSQDVPLRPKFEVASIKRNTLGGFGIRILAPSPRRFEADNVWLRLLIQTAWNVKDYQITGGPGWAGSDRYDVQATTDSDASFDQKRLMLQALLEDRFQLMLHRETKESQVYELVAAKGGVKLPPSIYETCVVPPRAQSPGRDPSKDCGFMRMSPSSVDATAINMEQLALALSNALQRTVIDRSGLTGIFDVRLEWTADQSTPGLMAPGLPPAAPNATDPNGKSIFTTVQEQLGLKLESAKGPVDFLVIDRLERPSEN